MSDKQYIVRVDTMPPLYFGPFTSVEAASEASNKLQNRYEHETGTYMVLGDCGADDSAAIEFNSPDYEG
jgi:hypothetical protein